MNSVLVPHNKKENLLTEDSVLLPSAVFSQIDVQRKYLSDYRIGGKEGRTDSSSRSWGILDEQSLHTPPLPKDPEVLLNRIVNNHKLLTLHATEDGKYLIRLCRVYIKRDLQRETSPVCRCKELSCTLKAETHVVTSSGSVNFYVKLSYISIIYEGLFLSSGNANPQTLFQF